MTQARFWIAAGIIAVVIIGGFALSVPHTTRDLKEAKGSGAEAPVPVVSIHDAYKKGVHTITGSLMAPNACTSLTSAASLSESSTTPAIIISISMPTDTGICLQVPTLLTFKEAALTAPSGVPFVVTINGHPASTTAL